MPAYRVTVAPADSPDSQWDDPRLVSASSAERALAIAKALPPRPMVARWRARGRGLITQVAEATIGVPVVEDLELPH